MNYDPSDLEKLTTGDRAFVESIEDEAKRETVACSLILHRVPDSLSEGDDAPPLRLRPIDGGPVVDAGSFVGDRPVMLIFGSYT